MTVAVDHYRATKAGTRRQIAAAVAGDDPVHGSTGSRPASNATERPSGRATANDRRGGRRRLARESSLVGLRGRGKLGGRRGQCGEASSSIMQSRQLGSTRSGYKSRRAVWRTRVVEGTSLLPSALSWQSGVALCAAQPWHAARRQSAPSSGSVQQCRHAHGDTRRPLSSCTRGCGQ